MRQLILLILFLFHVVTGELIIDNEENFRCDFIERVVRHYLDMKPLNVRAIKESWPSTAQRNIEFDYIPVYGETLPFTILYCIIKTTGIFSANTKKISEHIHYQELLKLSSQILR